MYNSPFAYGLYTFLLFRYIIPDAYLTYNIRSNVPLLVMILGMVTDFEAAERGCLAAGRPVPWQYIVGDACSVTTS